MAQSKTNNATLQYAVQSGLGTLGGSPQWRLTEPNSIGAYGATFTRTPRNPISRVRGRRKGAVTDKDSSVEYSADLTMDSFADHIEGAIFSEFANTEFDLKSSSGTLPPPAVDGGGGNDSFTIDAASALLAGKMVYAGAGAISLVYAKGYTNSQNNGIWPLAADVASTDTAVEVATASLVAETPGTNASLQVCGVRVTDNDLTLTVSGSTATLVSAADISDWATLGLRAGMYIHIGGVNTSTGAVQNALNASATDDTYGYARVVSVSSGTLNLDKLPSGWATADNNGEGVADVLFGRFVRNVATSADSDDNRYLERYYQFEVAYDDLGGVGTDEYEYAVDNFCDAFTLNYGLTDKATVDFGFIGTDSDDITSTRKTNAASAVDPLRIGAFNTSSDFAKLTTDVISSASDVCFKSLSITFGNEVSPEKCLGTLGATGLNTGQFLVDIEAQMQFTDKAIINAIKNNTTVTFAAVVRNSDGAIALDVPSMTLDGGDREFPQNETILVNLTGEAFNDPDGTIPDVSIGITLFPVVPWV